MLRLVLPSRRHIVGALLVFPALALVACSSSTPTTAPAADSGGTAASLPSNDDSSSTAQPSAGNIDDVCAVFPLDVVVATTGISTLGSSFASGGDTDPRCTYESADASDPSFVIQIGDGSAYEGAKALAVTQGLTELPGLGDEAFIVLETPYRTTDASVKVANRQVFLQWIDVVDIGAVPTEQRQAAIVAMATKVVAEL